MSAKPHFKTIRKQFAGRWQIPLLLLSIFLLITAIVKMRPEPEPARVEDALKQLQALKSGLLYPEALGVCGAGRSRSRLSEQ